MGITHVTVNIANLQKDRPSYEADFLVDTGAIDCLAPASALEAAGIEIEGREVCESANVEVVEYPYGVACVSVMGNETVTQSIFGHEGREPILGTVALENTGIGVDPAACTLRRMAAKPLKWRRVGLAPVCLAVGSALPNQFERRSPLRGSGQALAKPTCICCSKASRSSSPTERRSRASPNHSPTTG